MPPAIPARSVVAVAPTLTTIIPVQVGSQQMVVIALENMDAAQTLNAGLDVSDLPMGPWFRTTFADVLEMQPLEFRLVSVRPPLAYWRLTGVASGAGLTAEVAHWNQPP